MAVPKRKKTHSKTRMGRSHDLSLLKKRVQNCSRDENTGSVKRSHHISNGYYNGKKVIKENIEE